MSMKVSVRTLRVRRSVIVLIIGLAILFLQGTSSQQYTEDQQTTQTGVLADSVNESEKASELLETLAVKGRAPKTGYKRSEFGDGWAKVGSCDMRNIMLKRYLVDYKLADNGCIVLSGKLEDVYTATTIQFTRGASTSDDVQIDHVVALSDSWQKGAQGLSFERRVQLANDPLNLLPVEGDANQKKGDSDAASWLPPNKNFRCAYVARQIAVKSKYSLWVTEAEKAAMKRVLNGCGEQVVPIESAP